MMALLLLAAMVGLVYFDRDAYTDSHDGSVTLLDALYYATVSITTTGYGDITPIEQHSRLLNALAVTPMRIMFLVLLVGTTLEVLASEGRRIFRDQRWRRHLGNHVVILGYGTKGKSAAGTLVVSGTEPAAVVVVDSSPSAIAEANLRGYAAIQGDGASRDILRRAEISRARQVIISLDRDDSAVLATLTTRQLSPTAHIVVSVREDANSSLVRQSGANAVVTSSEAVGRLLGISAVTPDVGVVLEDLITAREGLEFAERHVAPEEVGMAPDEIRGEPVIAVIRDRTLRRFYDPLVAKLQADDQLVIVRRGDVS